MKESFRPKLTQEQREYGRAKRRLRLANKDGRWFANTPHGRKEVVFERANFDTLYGITYTVDKIKYWHDTPWMRSEKQQKKTTKENARKRLWSLTK